VKEPCHRCDVTRGVILGDNRVLRYLLAQLSWELVLKMLEVLDLRLDQAPDRTALIKRRRKNSSGGELWRSLK